MLTNQKIRKNDSKAAFTLTELLVAMTALTIAMFPISQYYLTSLNTYYYDVGKLRVNRDIRTFTAELSDHATYANDFIIYTSFSDRTELSDEMSGDFLVLIFEDEDDTSLMTRMVGFYRAANASGGEDETEIEAPVQMFDLEWDGGVAKTNIDDYIPATSTLGSHDEVIELSKGLSDGRLFLNFRDRSIIVRGEIRHNTDDKRRNAVNTYNFTVSPRG